MALALDCTCPQGQSGPICRGWSKGPDREEVQRVEVLLVERSPALRIRLARVLSIAPGISVVAISGTCAEACQVAGVLQPDVAVVDVEGGLGEGLSLLRELRTSSPATYIICLTDAAAELNHYLHLADLCLDKAQELDRLADAVRRRHTPDGQRQTGARDPDPDRNTGL